MDVSNEADKSWDHPWTTEEMREKRREWSLAGDAGLLKHLQQFSENLVSRANKTQEALDTLTTQLSETAILIDNVTNTSLALANTQFIESRVQEDDVEIEKKVEQPIKEPKDRDLETADLIASVSESVRQGLSIMDEKYQQMEVMDSDSEGEDDIVLSVILGPNNPYQERPLPYVIGSDKWNNSTKVGLESSSSESEQLDEEDEESESEKENARIPKVNVARLSSSSSESDNYNRRSNIAYMDNGNLTAGSQNNIDSLSESPIDNVSKAPLSNDGTPSFAEELAKRLGTVRQSEKSVNLDEKSEASINRLKDDLFTPEEGDNVYSNKAENVFTASKGLLSDSSSANLWKEKPIKSYKSNIIPASIDVPPPISTISTKPKSSIDDLFPDADSEDSDDIFSSKTTIRKISKTSDFNTAKIGPTEDDNQKKNLLAPGLGSHMTTSTPETNANTGRLFSDDECGDLFGSAKGQSQRSDDVITPAKKKPAGSISILGNVLASDIENKVLSRMPRAQSSGSSGSDSSANYESGKQSEVRAEHSRNTTPNDHTDEQSPIVQQGNNAENITGVTNSSYSSGISIRPPSINNTGASSIGVDFQPQMTSTRLKSEEIYRERIASDSLFASRTRYPVNVSNNSNSASNQPRDERVEESSIPQDDVFESDDLFGPPPLPKSESKPPKSKVSSLFDDSDSGDELFSTTSSGSRSQKSTDFLATTPHYPDKAKSLHRKGLFDDDIDIFGSKDSPDVDIFGIASKSTTPKPESNSLSKKPPESESLFKNSSRDSIMSKDSNKTKTQSAKLVTKKISLFDDDDDYDNDEEDGERFRSKPPKIDFKTEPSIFKEDDENDLFSSSGIDVKKQPSSVDKITAEKQLRPIDPGINEKTEQLEKKSSDLQSDKGLFSGASNSRSLIFEDDDYDDLFGEKIDSTKNKINEDIRPVTKDSESKKTEQSIDKEIEKSKEPQISGSNSKIVDVVKKPNVTTENVSRTIEIKTTEQVENSTRKNEGIPGVIETEVKRSPPKTLDIQNEVQGPPAEETEKTQRRTVSGKIKNLMGKVGEIKILSPMDTPPLWRRSEEKTDEEDSTLDRDSDDGGCMSLPGHSTPSSLSEGNVTRKQSLPSTASGGSNIEGAISFDEPAQVETLSTAASKTRVRIQAKRRPPSRHARKSALRHSGIDFDTVDNPENNVENKESNVDPGVDISNNDSSSLPTTSDRLSIQVTDSSQKVGDSGMYLGIDDKSELGSLSKESSMSANKNTLLSPSTDEEDLFDVPPDLPEDPQREDTLFGRAPILSPVDRVLPHNISSNFKPLRDTHISNIEDDKSDVEDRVERNNGKSSERDSISSPKDDFSVSVTKQTVVETPEQSTPESQVDDKTIESDQEPTDPLRDTHHDPLKDPSQLFAFVTKTPSPEKGKSLLFSEDDSLFSTSGKKLREERPKKQVLDLFADDADGDLFSAPLVKPVKKPLKDTKISLFDDDNQDEEDDSLFGSGVRKPSPKAEPSRATTVHTVKQKSNLFDEDDNDINLFCDQSGQSQKSGSTEVREQVPKNDIFQSNPPNITEPPKSSSVNDIFGDPSSGEDDIFISKLVTKKTKSMPAKSLFPLDDDDDSGQIFSASSTTSESKIKPTESRPSVKKSVTRDLKKTAEKIVEDPLSLLQDD